MSLVDAWFVRVGLAWLEVMEVVVDPDWIDDRRNQQLDTNSDSDGWSRVPC